MTRPPGRPAPAQRRTEPFVSGRVRIATNAIAAPTATVQSYHSMALPIDAATSVRTGSR